MAKSFGDYLAGAGYFLLDTTRKAVLRHDDETVQQEREAVISILTAALYEAKIKDPEIIRLLQKYMDCEKTKLRNNFVLKKQSIIHAVSSNPIS